MNRMFKPNDFLFILLLGFVNCFCQSLWTWRNPLPQGNDLCSITSGNNQVVAVGGYGTILTSLDGANWSIHSSGTENLRRVIYSGNQFVAVGSTGTIITSLNGNSWTSIISGTTKNLNSVAYGNGLFVAVGNHGTILTSSDGLNWVCNLLDTTRSYNDISFGNGCFIIVGDGKGEVLKSTDGTNWSHVPLNTPTTPYGFYSVAFLNNQFIATDANGTIFFSMDGIAWSIKLLSSHRNYIASSFGNNKFITVGDTILSSLTGDSWVGISSMQSRWLAGITFYNNKFIVVGVSGTILTSIDGTNWIKCSSDITNIPKTWLEEPIYLNSVTYGNNLFVAVGVWGVIIKSTDGVTWNKVVDVNGNCAYSIAYGNGSFVAVGIGTHGGGYCGYICTSLNGLNWTFDTTTSQYPLYGVSFINNQFVAVGDSGIILFSSNGSIWQKQQPLKSVMLKAVTYGNGQFVATGWRLDTTIIGCEFLSSTDGINWNKYFAESASYIGPIGYGNSQFIAFGTDSLGPVIFHSSDGSNWSKSPCFNMNTLICRGNAILYQNGLFIVSGSNGTGGIVCTSTDGKIWNTNIVGSNYAVTSVTYGKNLFIAVGLGGTIFSSQVDSPSVIKPISKKLSSKGVTTVIANNILTIVFPQIPFHLLNVNLFTVSGRKIYSSSYSTTIKTLTLSTNGFPIGTYILKITGMNHFQLSSKIILIN